MTDDPIRAYLVELGRELGRFAPHRRRVLGEVEDHLREAAATIEATGIDPPQAASQAVEQFGAPQIVASRFSRPTQRKWLIVVVPVTLLVAAVAVALAKPSASHAIIPMTASNAPVPHTMRNAPAGQRSQPGQPIPPGTRIDAYAPLSNDATYVFTAYVWHGWLCDSSYLAVAESVTPDGEESGSECRPPGSPRPAVDLQLEAGSGRPFILSGTAPFAANQLAITTGNGMVRTFSLPHIPLHSDRYRQAVILDLTAVGISSVTRLTLLTNSRPIASLKLGAA